jgi:transposase
MGSTAIGEMDRVGAEVAAMSMGKREGKQQPMWHSATELPRSPGHKFYEKLNDLLAGAKFDQQVEALCERFYAAESATGRRSIPPGVYFRMLMIGYFEGIESERGIAWRCTDSLSLRAFLGLLPNEAAPDHSSLSRIRSRLDVAVYDEVFKLVLGIVDAQGLLRGKVAGIDSTYLRADASMKAIVRKDNGLSYQEYLKKLCEAQGIENPTIEDARRVDRKRKGKRTSNQEWQSKTDADARITRLKDGRTRLGYKAEHVVDMNSGVIVAAVIHAADQGDTATVEATLETARKNIEAAKGGDGDAPDSGDDPPAPSAPGRTISVVADKGYHKAELLKTLKRRGFRTYVAVPKSNGAHHWTDKGGYFTARAYRANRDRVASEKGKALLRERGELLERTFAHACETGGQRRVRLRGKDNVAKRYRIQAAALNLGIVMRHLFGNGTPRQTADARKRLYSFLALLHRTWTLLFVAVQLTLWGPGRQPVRTTMV